MSSTASTASTAPTAPTASTTYSLIYRGNAIDGWISAFIAHTALKQQDHETRLVSIRAGCGVTDHQVAAWKKTHVMLLDLSMDHDAQKRLLDGGVLSLTCVDHHETAVADWPEGTVDVTVCTALQVWRRWYSYQEVPFWLDAVNRISLWKQPIWDDRCMREVLTPVAHMPPMDALRATEALMTWMTAPQCSEFQGLLAQGQQRLMAKDQELMAFLLERGQTRILQEQDVKTWGLSPEWVGLSVFLLENSDRVIDTNEAAHLVFTHSSDVGAFINFRKKAIPLGKGKGKSKNMGLVYHYSARSVSFDLTTGGFLQGQQHSAGAQALFSETAPFCSM